MESKDIMELIDRLVLLTEEHTRLDETVEQLKDLFFERQISNAEWFAKHPNESGDPYNISISSGELKRIFGWGDSYKARDLLKENGIER